MRKLPVVLALAVLACLAPAGAQTPAPAAPAGGPPVPRARVSPHDTISANVGPGPRGDSRKITISYGRPYSKDPKTGEIRKIWGGLVKSDTPERLGADEATLLITPAPIVIGATTIPAGAYTLYIVAGEGGAKLAFSSNIAKWGIPVDDKHDVARVDLVKSSLENSVDQLTLTLERQGASDNYSLNIWWEKTKFSLPFALKTS